MSELLTALARFCIIIDGDRGVLLLIDSSAALSINDDDAAFDSLWDKLWDSTSEKSSMLWLDWRLGRS